MMLLAFSVFDAKADAYLRPFFAETKGLALRSFIDSVQDPQSPMFKHAEDYTLFRVGVFDQATGKFEACIPEGMGNAVQFRELRAS